MVYLLIYNFLFARVSNKIANSSLTALRSNQAIMFNITKTTDSYQVKL